MTWCKSLLLACGIGLLGSSAYAETFIKRGNNGTASCDLYCRSSDFGGIERTGECVQSYRQDTGQAIGCNVTPGLLSNAQELTCTCTKARVKYGNNGTATCNQYCMGTQYGGWR